MLKTIAQLYLLQWAENEFSPLPCNICVCCKDQILLGFPDANMSLNTGSFAAVLTEVKELGRTLMNTNCRVESMRFFNIRLEILTV
jgi:hypothetical protein